MIKAIIFALIITLSFGELKEINITSKKLSQTKSSIISINEKLKYLARDIKRKERSLKYLNYKIKQLNNQIKALQKKVENSSKDLTTLNDLKKGYQEKLNALNKEIYTFLSENYYIQNQNIENLNDLIYNELTQQVLNQYSKKIAKIAKEAREINQKIAQIDKKIIAIKQRQYLLEKKKEKLAYLLKKRQKEIQNLKQQKEAYKNRLTQMLKIQKSLEARLEKLKILSKKIKESDFTSNEEVPTYIYKGLKSTPPIQGIVVEKFGRIKDPISHIVYQRPFVIIKAFKPNALVRSVLKGEVINILKDKKLIAIRHKNGLITIYKVNKISPLLKVGKFVKRGEVIGRVKEYLQFGVFKNGKPINPQKVFPLK
jgi:murein DD-endopeptidase MepM/ murein hydrolase activator NlpD